MRTRQPRRQKEREEETNEHLSAYPPRYLFAHPRHPGAGRHRLWSVEDPPESQLPEEEQRHMYRRIAQTLEVQIRPEILLPTRYAVLPHHK